MAEGPAGHNRGRAHQTAAIPGKATRLALDPQDLACVAADDVDPAVRARLHVADLVLPGEERFLADDGVAVEHEAPQRAAREPSDEQASLPLGKAGAGV